MGAGTNGVRAGYGPRNTLPRLLWADVRDRLGGDPGRANARWGYLKPPGERGPVVWLRTGGDRFSVGCGAGLLAALRDHRLDLRLVQTFEEEHEDLLTLHLRGVQRRAGAGFGPCSHPKALRRAVERLQPLGLVSIGRAPESALAESIAAYNGHSVVMAAEPEAQTRGFIEAAYPVDAQQAQRWQGQADYVAPPADPTSLLALSDASPTLRQLVRVRAPLRVWWCHGSDSLRLKTLAEAFRTSPLAEDGVLFLSGSTPEAVTKLKHGRRLSLWDRAAPEPGQIMLVDDFRWLATLGVSADGVHLDAIDPEMLWASLNGSAAITTSDPASLNLRLTQCDDPGWIATVTTHAELLAYWGDDAGTGEGRWGELNRRALWAERRHASTVVQELLGRVYDW